MPSTKEAFGTLSELDRLTRLDELARIASGDLRGFRLFNAASETYLRLIVAPATWDEETTKAWLDKEKSELAQDLWPESQEPVEIAHVTMDTEEAHALLHELMQEDVDY